MFSKESIKRIRLRMVELEIKQAVLAHQLGWDQTKISKLLNRQQSPKLFEIEALASMLKISALYLLFGDEKTR